LNKITVLAVGSPQGADQLAWFYAEQLQQQFTLKPDLGSMPECVILDRPGARLLEYFQGDGAVVLLDAVLDAAPAGTIREFSLSQLLDGEVLFSSHQFGVQQSLALAQALGTLPSTLKVWGISAGAEPLSMSPSQCRSLAQKAAAGFANSIKQLIDM